MVYFFWTLDLQQLPAFSVSYITHAITVMCVGFHAIQYVFFAHLCLILGAPCHPCFLKGFLLLKCFSLWRTRNVPFYHAMEQRRHRGRPQLLNGFLNLRMSPALSSTSGYSLPTPSVDCTSRLGSHAERTRTLHILWIFERMTQKEVFSVIIARHHVQCLPINLVLLKGCRMFL